MFLAAVIVLNAAGTSRAQSIWANPIVGTDPGASNPFAAGDVVSPGITVSGIGMGAGIVNSSGNQSDRYQAENWNTTLTLDATEYFNFTLTPLASTAINFTSFVYAGQRSAQGPSNYAFRSSLDSFVANIGTPAATGATISLSGASYQNIAAPISFRLYGYNAGNSNGDFSVNDFTFTGTVVSTATNFHFDVNGATAGSGVVAGTTYNFSSASWSASPAGTAVTGTFTSGQTPTFSAGNDGIGKAVTVNIDAAVSANGLSFEEGNVTLAAGAGTLTLTSPTVNVAAGATATISEQILGAGSLGITKIGTGTLLLTGANATAANINVNGGTLAVNRNASGTPGTVTVNNGGLLTGTGPMVQVMVNSGGAVNPGNSPGIMDVAGPFDIAGTGALQIEIVAPSTTIAGAVTKSVAQILTEAAAFNGAAENSAAGTGYGTNHDHLNVTGTFSITGTGTIEVINFNSLYTSPQKGDVFNVIDATGYAFSDFDSGPEYRYGTAAENALYDLDLPVGLAGFGQGALAFNTSMFQSLGLLVVVPEPSQGMLFLSGMCLLVSRRRRLR